MVIQFRCLSRARPLRLPSWSAVSSCYRQALPAARNSVLLSPRVLPAATAVAETLMFP